MAEVFGMKVDLELVVKNMKKVQQQVGAAFKNIPGGIAQGAGLGGGGAGETAGALGKMTGKLALISGSALLILEGVKKIVGLMTKSSPYLKGIFEVFSRAMMIFFRPFGDALAAFLKPMAILMMKMAVAFLKFTRTTPAGGLVAKAGVGAGAGAAVGGAIGGLPGAVLGAAVGTALALLPDAIQGVKNLGTIVTAWADKAAEVMFGINMDKIRAKVATFMLETWPRYVGEIREKVAVFMLEDWPEFVDTMKTKTIEGWETIKTFFSETVVGWVTDAFNGIKTFFTETIPGWVDTMIDSIKDKFSFGFGGGGGGGSDPDDNSSGSSYEFPFSALPFPFNMLRTGKGVD